MDYSTYLERAIDDILTQYNLPRIEPTNVIQPITYERAAILNNIAYWEDILTRRYPEYKQGTKVKHLVKALKSFESVHDYLALFESMVIPALLNKPSQWNKDYFNPVNDVLSEKGITAPEQVDTVEPQSSVTTVVEVDEVEQPITEKTDEKVNVKSKKQKTSTPKK